MLDGSELGPVPALLDTGGRTDQMHQRTSSLGLASTRQQWGYRSHRVTTAFRQVGLSLLASGSPREDIMIVRKWVAVAALTAAAGSGAVLGTSMWTSASAATPGVTTPSPAVTPPGPAGTRQSNEGAGHEAGESPAREAAENNGTATYGPPPGGTNDEPGGGANTSIARV